jgi:hypothetical protein
MRYIDRDGTTHTFSGEWHFGWVLEGRAVQDVLITRSPDGEIVGYGSTVRSFDHRTGQWWIVWQDPLAGEFSVLLAEREGDRIVLRGQWTLGDATRSFRWTFSAITQEAFHWECHILEDGGEWRLAEEMWAKRVSGGRCFLSFAQKTSAISSGKISWAVLPRTCPRVTWKRVSNPRLMRAYRPSRSFR